METKQRIPHNVRAIARQAYRHCLHTAKTIGHCGEYTTQVRLGEGIVIVLSCLHQSRYDVPIAQSWG